jgi:hypothetical protein
VIAAAAAVLLLASGDFVRWSADTDVQARGREEPSAGRSATVGELAASALLVLAAHHADESATLSWFPRALLREPLAGTPAGGGNSTQQGGRLDLETRMDPTTLLAWRSAIDWGLTDLSPLAAQPGLVGPGLYPAQRFVHTLSLGTGLDLRQRLSRRLDFAVSAGFQRSGGLGAEAVAVLPMQVGALGNASLNWAATRESTLSLLANGSHTHFSTGLDSQFGESQLAFGTRVTRQLSVDLSSGVAFIRTRGGAILRTHAYGAGMAGFRCEFPLSVTRRVSTSLRARLSPTVDRFTGLAVETARAEGTADLTDGALGLGFAASGGRVVSGAFVGTEDLHLDARSSWTLNRGLSVYAAAGSAWTNQAGVAGWQSQVYFGLRWTSTGVL